MHSKILERRFCSTKNWALQKAFKPAVFCTSNKCMQASHLIFFSCSWFFSRYCVSIWYPFPMFTLTCRLLTKPGGQETVMWKLFLFHSILVHSPSPCPIHCSLVSEHSSPQKNSNQFIWFSLLPGSRNYCTPTFLFFLQFMLINYSYPWKAVASYYNSCYTSPCASFSALPFCCRLAAVSHSFSTGKEKLCYRTEVAMICVLRTSNIKQRCHLLPHLSFTS